MTTIEGLFRRHSFETGMHHPAEDFLREAWKYDREGIVLEVARILATNGGIGPDLLRCLGRVPAAADDGIKWVTDALKRADYDWRDAAFYALEHWGSPEGWRILQAHAEPDPYLDDYKRQLLEERDLSGHVGDHSHDVVVGPIPVTGESRLSVLLLQEDHNSVSADDGRLVQIGEHLKARKPLLDHGEKLGHDVTSIGDRTKTVQG